MCDEFSARLIAWIDGELPENEAAEVARHLGTCVECRARVEMYRETSGAVADYCEAVVAESGAGMRGTRLLPVVAGAAAVIALMLAVPWARVARHKTKAYAAPVEANVGEPAAVPAIPRETARPKAPVKGGVKLRREVVAARTPVATPATSAPSAVGWAPAEPAIEVAIPAEAMFPPGAVPEGVSFVANVSVGADGTTQQLRLRTRLTGLEGR
jgi:anti-sigma factor RsiW